MYAALCMHMCAEKQGGLNHYNIGVGMGERIIGPIIHYSF